MNAYHYTGLETYIIKFAKYFSIFLFLGKLWPGIFSWSLTKAFFVAMCQFSNFCNVIIFIIHTITSFDCEPIKDLITYLTFLIRRVTVSSIHLFKRRVCVCVEGGLAFIFVQFDSEIKLKQHMKSSPFSIILILESR